MTFLPPEAESRSRVHDTNTDQALIETIDAHHARICRAERDLLRAIAEADRRELWRDTGARDLAHWLAMRHGISEWKARRWIGAAHALEHLPRLSDALASGELGIDKVVELARFAEPGDEARLLAWARDVSSATVRRRADAACRQRIEETQDAERSRFLSWWYFDEGRRFGLEAELPAAQGAVIANALARLADELPVMPGEEGPIHVDARRADALAAICSQRIASDADPDRATVVVHASLEVLDEGERGVELEGGGVIHPETARRLLCHGRVQAVLEDGAGNAVGLGRISREPSAAIVRHLRYRDRGCTFPGCGTRRFTQAHHIVWWRHGGRTDLDNLALVCSFHHKLVHEFGWSIRRGEDGEILWFHPDGHLYRAGPGPPRVSDELQPLLASTG